MRIIKPLDYIPMYEKTIFLAGSIEMGEAENWQNKVEKLLEDTDWIVLNPRRDDWDSTWEQSIENKEFYEQVNWEITGLERAKRIIVYFSPGTKSPISLLEFGLVAGREPKKLMVICPEGFWRKGNIDIVCDKYLINQYKTIEDAIERLKSGENDETKE